MWSRVFQIEGRCVLQDFWVILGESVRNLDSKIDSINSLSVFFSDLVPNFFCCSLLFEMMFSFESQKSVQSRVAGGGGATGPPAGNGWPTAAAVDLRVARETRGQGC